MSSLNINYIIDTQAVITINKRKIKSPKCRLNDVQKNENRCIGWLGNDDIENARLSEIYGLSKTVGPILKTYAIEIGWIDGGDWYWTCYMSHAMH